MVQHMVHAIKSPRLPALYMLLFCSASAATAVVGSQRLASQARETLGALDLTAEVPRDEQGYYHGIPGMSGGGASGGWQPGPGDTVRYRLPLGVEILHATPDKEGNFVFEVLLRNIDSAPFLVPSFRNMTAVEKPENRSRRIFFFKVVPLVDRANESETLGSATTGGSTSIPGSFIPLHPGESLRVMLPASSNLIRRSFAKESEKLQVKVTCQEWKLDDTRFFLSGISAELTSVNAIRFALHGEQIVPQP
jgi:hypothetical protein